jgi:quinone-modifying oxidoreductase subunit QmoC
MASLHAILPSPAFRQELARHGVDTVSRCYQCATCSATCELAPTEAPFPRRQILWAQWGLADRLESDPAVWLCHQCNDCTKRCPRDVRPGDVLQAVRAMTIERLAFPRWLGSFVARAGTTWPALFALPILFWCFLLLVTGHLRVPADFSAYGELVPHALIYAVFFPAAAWAVAASWVGGQRFWSLLGASSSSSGGLLRHLAPTLGEIATHKRFRSCDAARPRSTGHLLLMWGFVGAAVTSGLLVLALYVQKLPMPLALTHPYKLLGNFSALLLVIGGGWLVATRVGSRDTSGRSSAFDIYFLTLVMLVIATGVLTEVARFALPSEFALLIYIVHLGAVLSLFITFPYSKFAHLLYRSLAMLHQRVQEGGVASS